MMPYGRESPFVWDALVLVAETTNYTANFRWWNGWGVFFTGIRIAALTGTVIRLQISAYRKKWVGSLTTPECQKRPRQV